MVEWPAVVVRAHPGGRIGFSGRRSIERRLSCLPGSRALARSRTACEGGAARCSSDAGSSPPAVSQACESWNVLNWLANIRTPACTGHGPAVVLVCHRKVIAVRTGMSQRVRGELWSAPDLLLHARKLRGPEVSCGRGPVAARQRPPRRAAVPEDDRAGVRVRVCARWCRGLPRRGRVGDGPGCSGGRGSRAVAGPIAR